MSALTRHLALDLDADFGTPVTGLSHQDERWMLHLEESTSGPFDAVVVTAPPEQTTALIQGISPLAEITQNIPMEPCWALMAAFDQPLESDHDAYFVNEGPLSWVARNNSKPGRPPAEAWVAHASPTWSRENLELEKDEVAEQLLPELFATVSVHRVRPERIHVHRWRFARSGNDVGSPCLWDSGHRLAVAGDWVYGSRVEDAFLSGVAAAGRIMGV
jgi:predicted NAD/FAD-dependent oxidoreductase